MSVQKISKIGDDNQPAPKRLTMNMLQAHLKAKKSEHHLSIDKAILNHGKFSPEKYRNTLDKFQITAQ